MARYDPVLQFQFPTIAGLCRRGSVLLKRDLTELCMANAQIWPNISSRYLKFILRCVFAVSRDARPRQERRDGSRESGNAILIRHKTECGWLSVCNARLRPTTNLLGRSLIYRVHKIRSLNKDAPATVT